MCKQSVKRCISIWAMILIVLALVFAWRVVCGSLLPILPPGAQLRLTVDLPLIFFSPIILSCLCCLVVVFMLLFFCAPIFVVEDGVQIFVYRLLPILLPGAQLRLTVDLPLIVSSYRTSDIPFAAKSRNIFCYLDKYIDNFWQWFGKM